MIATGEGGGDTDAPTWADRLTFMCWVYWGLSGYVVIALHWRTYTISGKWGAIDQLNVRTMLPVCAVGAVLSVIAVLGRPSKRRNRLTAIGLALFFLSATAVVWYLSRLL